MTKFACNSFDGYPSDMNEEGRINHYANWEYLINAWMRKYYYD
jgi:hypothetical protein